MASPLAEILVMARAPVRGQAKTRLIPALGEAGAARLHAYLVERLLQALTEASVAPISLCCTPDTQHEFFQNCREKYGVRLQAQQGKDLGERLHHALQKSLETHRYAVVVGSDIPTLGPEDIKETLQLLQQGHQAVLGPAEDGGYTLLGVSLVDPGLFMDISWGSEQVLMQTRQRLSQLEWRWAEVRVQWDVDRPQDLQRLTQLDLPPELTALLIASVNE